MCLLNAHFEASPINPYYMWIGQTIAHLYRAKYYLEWRPLRMTDAFKGTRFDGEKLSYPYCWVTLEDYQTTSAATVLDECHPAECGKVVPNTKRLKLSPEECAALDTLHKHAWNVEIENHLYLAFVYGNRSALGRPFIDASICVPYIGYSLAGYSPTNWQRVKHCFNNVLTDYQESDYVEAPGHVNVGTLEVSVESDFLAASAMKSLWGLSANILQGWLVWHLNERLKKARRTVKRETQKKVKK